MHLSSRFHFSFSLIYLSEASPMASSSSSPNPNPLFQNGFDPNSILPHTTFVQADPSTFRSIVQRLTGASPTKIAARTSSSAAMAPRRHPFKLHERRQTARKLEIKLGGGGDGATALHSPLKHHHRGFSGEGMVMVSPVSTLAMPRSPMEEEERAIAEKGFYFHPSPLSTPRGSDPPVLLELFPLHPTQR